MNKPLTDKERHDIIIGILNAAAESLERYNKLMGIESPPIGHTSMDFPRDLSWECSMCGKPMEYRYCGMCTHCEMVWNG